MFLLIFLSSFVRVKKTDEEGNRHTQNLVTTQPSSSIHRSFFFFGCSSLFWSQVTAETQAAHIK